MTPREDQLIDALLHELHQPGPARDLAPSIMARLRQRRARHTAYRVGGGIAAAAACLALAFAGWQIAHTPSVVPAYPAPTLLVGDVEVHDGATLQRGASLTARSQAALNLGGYAEIALEPGTTARLEGDDRDERIQLTAGRLYAAVDPNRHPDQRLTVATPFGEAQVVGTRFDVQLLTQGDSTMIGKQMILRVVAGTVALVGAFGTIDVHANEEVRSGSVVGQIVEVGDNAFVLYSDKHDERARFVPRWVGGQPADGGGLDEDMLKQIRELRRGMNVRVHWVYDERPRAVRLEVLEEGEREGEAARERPRGREGERSRREAEREREREGARERERAQARERDREAERRREAERDGDRPRERDGDRPREREDERDADRPREREGERDADRPREREGDRPRQREAEREREGARERERAEQRERERARDRERERDGDRPREREGERDADRPRERDVDRPRERERDRDGDRPRDGEREDTMPPGGR